MEKTLLNKSGYHERVVRSFAKDADCITKQSYEFCKNESFFFILMFLGLCTLVFIPNSFDMLMIPMVVMTLGTGFSSVYLNFSVYKDSKRLYDKVDYLSGYSIDRVYQNKLIRLALVTLVLCIISLAVVYLVWIR